MAVGDFTKGLFYAACEDAAARSKRQRGLAHMDDEANDAYHAEFERLWRIIGGVDGWIGLPT